MNKLSESNKINHSSQKIELDPLTDRLLVLEKIQKGLDEVTAGNTIPHEHVVELVSMWSKHQESKL